MKIDELLAEGRALMRPTVFLRSFGPGKPAARWYGSPAEWVSDDYCHCWITVDCANIPGWESCRKTQYMSVFACNRDLESGFIELTDEWPDRKGVDLFGHAADVIAPIDAVIARGSARLDDWLRANNWERHCRYNDNYKDFKTVDPYIRRWLSEFPIYLSDVYAALGGWHWPGPDHDWHDLIDEQLCVLTVEDSEPWVETWRLRDGTFKIIQRIT